MFAQKYVWSSIFHYIVVQLGIKKVVFSEDKFVTDKELWTRTPFNVIR